MLHHLLRVVKILGDNVVPHVGRQAETEHSHEGCLWSVVLWQQGKHLSHQFGCFHVFEAEKLDEFKEGLLPSEHGVPLSKDNLLSLLGIGIGGVNVVQDVADSAVGSLWQIRQGVVELRGAANDVGYSELAFNPAIPSHQIVDPEFWHPGGSLDYSSGCFSLRRHGYHGTGRWPSSRQQSLQE
jgi:hypothetical protein